MTYNEYIELGFERGDINDPVELRNTGYSGYWLECKLKKGLLISTSFGELDKPKLYIKRKNDSETYTIIPITDDIVRDLIKSNK